MHEMDHIKKVYASCFFLFVSERTPSYAVSVSDNEENESEDVVYQKL